MAIKLKSSNANLNLKADIGQLIKGEDGGYYIPSVDEAGNLTWIASEEDMPEIVGANIMGPQGIDGKDGVPGKDGKDGVDGDSGVYVGTTEPTDPEALIWINPEGEGSITPGGDIDLTGYATEEYVDNAIANIEIPETDLTGYATETFVEDAINNALEGIAHAEDGAY